MATLRRVGCIGLAFAAGAALPAAERPASPLPPDTQDLYVGFILNLTRFITWPEGVFPSANAPIVIGTFPRDPLNQALDAAAQTEVVDGHPVRTLRLQSLDDVGWCQVIFISRRDGIRPAAALARLAHRPILAIGDADGFLELGGHFRFLPRGAKIGLQVSAENLKASGLEARAEVLRLATSP